MTDARKPAPRPDYLTSCPEDGTLLVAHAGQPGSTPWLCYDCRFGWWTAELSPLARSVYRAGFHDWGTGPVAAEIRVLVDAERDQAFARGTSALPEHLPALTPDELDQVARWNLHPDFAALVDEHRAARNT